MPTSAAPDFDPDTAPEHPFDLMAGWLDQAIDGGVAAPHAMTLATGSAEGPDARTVILQDVVTADGGLTLRFASSAESPKGRQLAADPRVAVVLHWREQHRQIRATGVVRAAPRDVSDEDFRGRSAANRAGILAAPQSSPLPPADEVEDRLDAARERIDADPDLVASGWTVYLIDAHTIEFWQGPPRSAQQRLRYRRDADVSDAVDASGWRREQLQP